MAAQSLSRTFALGSKCSGVIGMDSGCARGEFMRVGSATGGSGLGGGVLRSVKSVKSGGSVERVEFGRDRSLRRRGGDIWCAAGAPALEKERKGLPDDYMEKMQEFLRKDLVHLFDEQGIDKTMYDERVEFRDPITNYDTLDGYLFNIGMLRALFHPIFEMHSVKQVHHSFSLSGCISNWLLDSQNLSPINYELRYIDVIQPRASFARSCGACVKY